MAVDNPHLRDLGVIEVSPAVVRGELRSTEARELLLRLEVAWDVTATCSRCLETRVSPRRSELVLLVETARTEAGGAGRERKNRDDEDDQGDEHVVFAVDDELDTGPLVVEHVHLELPMRVVCQPDCPGLCPTCGVRRGDPSCVCAPAAADARWAPLAALKDRQN